MQQFYSTFDLDREDERLAAERHAIDNPVVEDERVKSDFEKKRDEALFDSFDKEDDRTGMLSHVFNDAGIESHNADGHTPLMRACALGREACVEALIQYSANAHYVELRHNRTALHWAAPTPSNRTQYLPRLRIGPGIDPNLGFKREFQIFITFK